MRAGRGRRGDPSLKISVVTAVYNRADTLSQAIRSVQSQAWRPLEHVIQDGGSIDGTLDVIETCRDATTSVLSENDEGLYDAINRGIARASGDVIGLMHSDDFFAHDRVLEKVASAFSDPTVDGVYGDLDYVSASNTNRIIRHWSAGEYRPDALQRGWMPPHPTLYLRRKVFETWGLYDTSFQIAADYDAMLRFLAKGRIRLVYVPEVLVKMRVGGVSNRSLGRILQKSREDYRALHRNGVGGAGTLARKNFRKITQFLKRSGSSS